MEHQVGHIPLVWQVVFGNVQAAAPKAMMAGGCLRDLFAEKPVNDIDIFVPVESLFEAEKAIKLTHPAMTKTIAEAYLTHDTDVSSIWYYQTLLNNLPPVNLILVSEERCTLDYQLTRFDFGICQIGWAGGELLHTEAYSRDVENKTFTLKDRQSDTQYAHSMTRWDRLSRKYPEFTLVQPPRPEHVEF